MTPEILTIIIICVGVALASLIFFELRGLRTDLNKWMDRRDARNGQRSRFTRIKDAVVLLAAVLGTLIAFATLAVAICEVKKKEEPSQAQAEVAPGYGAANR